MKHYLKKAGFYSFMCICLAGFNESFRFKPVAEIITISAQGRQPALALAADQSVHVVFGDKEEIKYSISKDGGRSFTSPVKVATVPGMHLGLARGPQIAVTKDYIVVANVTKQGRILAHYRKKQAATWSQPVAVLDKDTTAMEGFVALAAGSGNTVYAAWLDVRLRGKNNVYSAYSTNGGQSWSKNLLVYASPAGEVCECCRPAIAADAKGNVFVMFRNNLAGARDMYLAHSKDKGQSFLPAQKLGISTWPLKACPMEGGGVAINAAGQPTAVWKRQSSIFLTSSAAPEITLGDGRACTVAASAAGPVTVWQQNGTIMARTPASPIATPLGAGHYPQVLATPRHNLVVWETPGGIVAQLLP